MRDPWTIGASGPQTNDRGEPMEDGWKISEDEARRRDPGYRDPRYD